MAIVVLYKRKDSISKNWPWREFFDSPKQAVEFIDWMGPDYDFVPFEQIMLSELRDLADNCD